MDYDAQPIQLPFGEGVSIRSEDKLYEQITTNDGSIVRIFRAPIQQEGKTKNTEYHGIIYRPSFKDTEQDFQSFKDLTDRLTQVTGEEIKNSKSDFMGYITHKGLEKHLTSPKIIVKYRDNNNSSFPPRMHSFASWKAQIGGISTLLAGYGSWIAMSTPHTDSMIVHGVLGTIAELMLGGMIGESGTGYYCGPLRAPGYIPTLIIYKHKLRNPSYVLDNFMETYAKLDSIKNNLGNHKKFMKISKRLDKFHGLIQELFPFTSEQRGFSIQYDHADKEKIIELFSYLLEGGNVPQRRILTKNPTQELSKSQPVNVDLVNPWDIEIPRVGDRK